MCDEISVNAKSVEAPAVTVHDSQVILEEFSEGPCEEVLQPRSIWGKKRIRLCIDRGADHRASSWVDELAGVGGYRNNRILPSLVPDHVGALIRGDFRIRSPDVEPKAVEGERMCVVLSR